MRAFGVIGGGASVAGVAVITGIGWLAPAVATVLGKIEELFQFKRI